MGAALGLLVRFLAERVAFQNASEQFKEIVASPKKTLMLKIQGGQDDSKSEHIGSEHFHVAPKINLEIGATF